MTILFLTGCTKENESDTQENSFSEETLLGTWTWQTALVTDPTNQQQGRLTTGEENCFEYDVKETFGCSDTQSNIVEECRILTLFNITFEATKIYDRNENYNETNIEINRSNNCETITHQNEPSDSFYSGAWEIEGETIFLNETYRKSESLRFGEERVLESYDESLFSWKVLSFSNEEMIIFWRTPDQIDYEITFIKS
ncbi:hypothetical protein ACOCEA_04875 [Maribacter sp. CXY002]|uniref:hypothetical protein n=1 Tax=Maribacter luteocoastalis TaxID=3407671 RepID=UPI003B676A7A